MLKGKVGMSCRLKDPVFDSSLGVSLDYFVHDSCRFTPYGTPIISIARILKDVLEIPDVPLKVRKLIVKLCNVVTHRAARLAAAGIGGILKKIGRDGSGGITGGRTRTDVKMRRTEVVIQGSLYTSYTMFREYLHEALWEIFGEGIAPHVLAATYSKDSVCG